MRGVRVASASRWAGNLPRWACTQNVGTLGRRAFASNTRIEPPLKGRNGKGRLVLAAVGGGLGVGLFAFGDDVAHAYRGAERTGRVVTALAVCINE
jgi:hypothetical protein